MGGFIKGADADADAGHRVDDAARTPATKALRVAHADSSARVGEATGLRPARCSSRSPHRTRRGRGRQPGARSHAVGRCGSPPARRGSRSVAHLFRARPRPDPARRLLPATGRQDPGLRVPRGPSAHAADPRARGRPGGKQHRPGLPAQRGADRGHRPRPRLRSRPGGPRERGRV